MLAPNTGSLNDITQTGISNAGPYVNAELKYNTETMLKWAIANDINVWLTTMFPQSRTAQISGATNASPIVLTATAHGIANSQTFAYISGVNGNTAANGLWTISVTDANTTSLTGSTGNGSYTNGGLVGCYSPQEEAVRQQFNIDLKGLVAQYQAKVLMALSDLDHDAVVNPNNWPNNATTWQDLVHPAPAGTTSLYVGAGMVAERMVVTRVTSQTSNFLTTSVSLEGGLLVGNDTDIAVTGLTRQATGNPINDAVLSATVYDGNGNQIGSPTSVAVQITTNGNYRGTIPGTLAIVVGTAYQVVVKSSNYNFVVSLGAVAKLRQASTS